MHFISTKQSGFPPGLFFTCDIRWKKVSHRGFRVGLRQILVWVRPCDSFLSGEPETGRHMGDCCSSDESTHKIVKGVKGWWECWKSAASGQLSTSTTNQNLSPFTHWHNLQWQWTKRRFHEQEGLCIHFIRDGEKQQKQSRKGPVPASHMHPSSQPCCILLFKVISEEEREILQQKKRGTKVELSLKQTMETLQFAFDLEVKVQQRLSPVV